MDRMRIDKINPGCPAQLTKSSQLNRLTVKIKVENDQKVIIPLSKSF